MASKVTFGEDVTVAGKNVPAGSYAIFTIPGENEWTVILNKNWKQGGTGQYQESEDVVRTQVKPVKLGTSMESFTILLDDIRPSSASLAMIWDKTMVELPFEVESDAKVMASIEKALNVDANEYFQAATYYHESGKDLKQAHDWVTQAIGMYEKNDQSPFWVYRRKALIEADMKDYKTAISTARQSLEKAKAAGNDDYVRMNEKSIAEWEKM
jgi:tetratricopeptide (TPR) repeat protein